MGILHTHAFLVLQLDADDPVQTVENFFDFAFLIKEKRAMESVQDGEPKAIATDINKLNAYMGNQRQQMVLSLSMKDLRELKVWCSCVVNCKLHRQQFRSRVRCIVMMNCTQRTQRKNR